MPSDSCEQVACCSFERLSVWLINNVIVVFLCLCVTFRFSLGSTQDKGDRMAEANGKSTVLNGKGSVLGSNRQFILELNRWSCRAPRR